MRTSRLSSTLAAVLCGAALFTSACGREREEPRTIESEPAPPAVEETVPVLPEAPEQPETPPADVELREERTVEAREQVAAAEREDLDAHQRELDRREAELTERARRLRSLERRERALNEAEREVERREAAAATERPAPQPAPEEAEEVEQAEPAPEAEAEMPEPSPEPEEELRAEEPSPEEPAPPATVEAGTVFAVEFLETLSSASSRPGETFRARINRDLRQDGRVVIPAGSEVVGEVTEAVPLRKVGGRAKLAVRFTDLVLPSGTSVPIQASFVGQGKSETGRDAATIGGAAAGGAILGRVLNKGDRSKGAVIGAVLGAVIGGVVASRTPGEEVTIGEGSVVDLKLDEAVEVRPRR